MRKGKHAVLGLAALASAAAIGGTWASWTQELKAGNEFMTGSYNTSLDETFKSPKNWKPGETTEKAVQITNKGTVDAMAKVVINQNWESFPLTFQAQGGRTEYAAVPEFNKDHVALLASGDADGDMESNRWGLPEVTKSGEAEGKWLLLNEEPEGEDNSFTLYYMGVIGAGESSPQILDGVTMNPHITADVIRKEYEPEYDEETGEPTGGFLTIETKGNAPGYENARYTMTVNATTVQATQAAVEEIFGAGDGSGESRTLESLIRLADDAVFEAKEPKTLKFDEANGTMTYVPYRNSDGTAEEGNWFMSFTNMVPGGVYLDRLSIENDSSKSWKLYMKAVPREQGAIEDELLEKIAMKVWYTDAADGQESLLYDGNATGSTLLTGGNADGADGERAVYLGGYEAGQKGGIRVELTLDKDLKLEEDPSLTSGEGESGLANKYAGALAKIDWEFMVTEVQTGGNEGGGSSHGGGGGGGGHGGSGGTTTVITDSEVPLAAPDSPLTDETTIIDAPVPLAVLPKTGDETPVVPAVVTLLGSGIILLWLGSSLRRKKEEQ